MMQLSSGALKLVHDSGDTKQKPVLQVADLKPIAANNKSPNDKPRFRLVLSDGEHTMNAMLATQLAQMVVDKKLDVQYIVRLEDFISNDASGTKIIIVLNLTVLSTSSPKIGNPMDIDKVGLAVALDTVRTAPPPNTAVTGIAPTSIYDTSPYVNKKSSAMTPTTPGGSQLYRPIQSLNPYQSGWTIRGRCTYKSDIRRFQNQRGEGQVISFELTDDSGSIRVTAFTELAPRVQETVMMGRLYSVKQGSLKPANERFNRSTSQYEMTLDMRSEFVELPDDGNTIRVKYNFTKIAELHNVEVKSSCDVIGVVQAVGPLGSVTLRSSGEPCARRTIAICDDSGAEIELTLWRNQAEGFIKEEDQGRHPVLLLKNANRGDFGGVSLNVNRDTSMELDPVNIPEADALRAWYDSRGGAGQPMTQMTAGRGGGKVQGERKTLEEARTEDIDPQFSSGAGGQMSFVTRGFVQFIRSDGTMSYPSDPDTKKKVVESSPGMWHSPSTDRQLTDAEVVHRYIMSLKIADHTGSQWVTAFDESGSVILGKAAGEMRTLMESDRAMYDSVVDDAKFRPLLMRINCREDEYKGETKIRYTIARCEPLDFEAESRVLLDEIKAYN